MSTITETRQALLAARLEAVMRRQGLSVRQLALRAGLPLSVVQKLIAGEGRQTSIWTLVQLADTLAVSLDYLVGRTKSDVDTEAPSSETRAQDKEATAPQPTRRRTRKAAPGSQKPV
jgi:transcriptional regulator with XRE-family HTH domain